MRAPSAVSKGGSGRSVCGPIKNTGRIKRFSTIVINPACAVLTIVGIQSHDDSEE